jgi:hypothetical protein
MRGITFGLAAALMWMATPGVSAQRQIQMVATIIDASGEALTALEPDDLRIFEDDVPGTVTKVELITRPPLKVQILIDNGVGMGQENLVPLRNGLRGLLAALPEGAEVTVVTTAPQPRFHERATTDRDALLASVGRLVPDSGAGRFVESLLEATQRFERDREEKTPIILMVGTTAGDVDVRDSDLNRIIDRATNLNISVSVVLLSSVGRGAGGDIQRRLGETVTNLTRGRYEYISAGGRLASLLPEIGSQIAEAYGGGSTQQVRVTAERPGGASGEVGRLRLGARAGLAVVSVVME